jgi:hypothetical protein
MEHAIMIRRLAVRAAIGAVLIFTVMGVGLADEGRNPDGVTRSGDEIGALKKRVEDQDRLIQQILADNRALTDRLDRLEKAQPTDKATVTNSVAATSEPEVPPIALPGEIPAAQPNAVAVQTPSAGVPTTPTVRASLAPDIAVIGNNFGRFLSARGDTDRNRPFLSEVEVAMEQQVYSGVKFHTVLAAGVDNDFSMGAEEAYVSFASLGGLPFSGTLGKKRLEFGKINPVHPHAWQYVDSPSVIANLLGPDGLNGNGLTLNYLLPIKSIFANLSFGYVSPEQSDVVSQSSPESPIYPVGIGVGGNLKTTRLWLSPELRSGSALEIGASHGWGRDGNGDGIRLTGIDATYKLYPSTFSKLTLQSEAYWHRRQDLLGASGWHTRSGYYALLNYAPTQYYDYGIRFDNSRYPWPIEGSDKSLSLIWSNHIAEAMILRLQYKYGDRTNDLLMPAKRGYSELYLQFIWGGGSHSHPLY